MADPHQLIVLTDEIEKIKKRQEHALTIEEYDDLTQEIRNMEKAVSILRMQ